MIIYSSEYLSIDIARQSNGWARVYAGTLLVWQVYSIRKIKSQFTTGYKVRHFVVGHAKNYYRKEHDIIDFVK